MDLVDGSEVLDGGSGLFKEGRAGLSRLAGNLWLSGHDFLILLLNSQTIYTGLIPRARIDELLFIHN